MIVGGKLRISRRHANLLICFLCSAAVSVISGSALGVALPGPTCKVATSFNHILDDPFSQKEQ